VANREYLRGETWHTTHPVPAHAEAFEGR
jgi:hypothetical protein